MVEKNIKLNEGFLVEEGVRNDFRRSEEFELPLRVAEALNLLNDMGILREERAHLVLSRGHGIGRSNSYSVWLDDTKLLSMFAYASQAIILESNFKKFSVDEFAEFLMARARVAFNEPGAKVKLTKSSLGLYCILRIVFQNPEKLSNSQALELIASGVPLTNIVSLWKEGASMDIIIDSASIPASWLDRFMGKKDKK
jgi:hypothetical protein